MCEGRNIVMLFEVRDRNKILTSLYVHDYSLQVRVQSLRLRWLPVRSDVLRSVSDGWMAPGLSDRSQKSLSGCRKF